MSGKHCVFRLGDDVLAVAVAGVGEVLPLTTPTPIPRCPPAVLGLLNLRGQAVAVVALEEVLGLPVTVRHRSQCLLLVRGRMPVAAVPVDGVLGVMALGPGREPDRTADPPWIGGFHDLSDGTTAVSVAADELVARLDRLRLAPRT